MSLKLLNISQSIQIFVEMPSQFGDKYGEQTNTASLEAKKKQKMQPLNARKVLFILRISCSFTNISFFG